MLFNQQQCFIYSTASFLSKLRAKKVEKLRILVIKTTSTNDSLPEISKMKYRNRIPEPGTTISGFADSYKKKKKKKINTNRPYFFDMRPYTHIFFFGLTVT
jgi:hypothetical protein